MPAQIRELSTQIDREEVAKKNDIKIQLGQIRKRMNEIAQRIAQIENEEREALEEKRVKKQARLEALNILENNLLG